MDKTLEMAIAAGIIPAPAQPATQGWTPPDLTPEGILGKLPGNMGQYLNQPEPGLEHEAPAQTTPTPEPNPAAMGGAPAAPAPQPMVKEGSSVSVSSRGFDQGKFDQAQATAKTGSPLDREMGAALPTARAMAQPSIDAAQGAHDSGVNAAKSMVDATTAKLGAQGIQDAFMGHLQDSFAQDEARINMEAQAKADQSKADYMMAIADFRASRVDPGQLFNNLNRGQQVGMLATAFVHDFLGAAGIKTSAMDSLNKGIDRNIDAQINNIKNKGEVAGAFKDLWYMQRSQAATDQEARTRVRGFMLEGAKQSIAANMAQYESGLATAQGQAAIAAIDKELAKNFMDVNDHINSNALALRTQALSKWQAQLQAASAAAATKVQADRLKYDKEKDAKMTAPDPSSYIQDTTASGGGRVRWQLIDGKFTRPEDGAHIKDRMGSLAQFDDQMVQMQQLVREHGTTPPNWAPDKWKSEKSRQIENLRDKMIMTWVYADSGKAINETEIKEKRKLIPVEDWLTNGGTEQQLAQTFNDMHVGTMAKMAPFVREIQPGESMYGAQLSPSIAPQGGVPSSVPGQAETAEANEVKKRGSAPPGVVDTAVKALARPDKHKAAAASTLAKMGVPEEAIEDYTNFLVNRKESTKEDRVAPSATGLTEKADKRPTAGMGALSALKASALQGDENAYRELVQMAFPKREPSTKEDINLREFAKFELSYVTKGQGRPTAKPAPRVNTSFDERDANYPTQGPIPGPYSLPE